MRAQVSLGAVATTLSVSRHDQFRFEDDKQSKKRY